MKNNTSLGKWISIIYRQLNAYISKELKPYSLSSGQYIFLMYLYKKDGINQEELTKCVKMDKATTARAIKKLENEGYVIRKVNQIDKRSYEVYLTDKAIKIKDSIINVLNRCTEILEYDLTDNEKDVALKLLEKMANNAERFMKDSREW